MQAIAAWVGAVLGVVNLVFAISGRRPPIYHRYKSATATDRIAIVITIVSGSTPVFVRRLIILPPRASINVMALGDDATMFRDHTQWSDHRQFSMLIPQSSEGAIQVSFGQSDLPCAMILQWSD